MERFNVGGRGLGMVNDFLIPELTFLSGNTFLGGTGGDLFGMGGSKLIDLGFVTSSPIGTGAFGGGGLNLNVELVLTLLSLGDLFMG